MGIPVVTPPVTNSAEWHVLANTINDSQVKSEISQRFSGANSVNLIAFSDNSSGGTNSTYSIDFEMCSGRDKIECTYERKNSDPITVPPNTISIKVTQNSNCSTPVNRIGDSNELDFLAYVLEEAKSTSPADSLVKELDKTSWEDFNVSVSGSTYSCVFTYAPDNGNPSYTKTATATLSGGSFGSISIT